MAVGVVLVRRLIGHSKTQPHNNAATNVKERFDAIRYKREGMPYQPDAALGNGKNKVCRNTNGCSTHTQSRYIERFV
jgi:hypothetical protein